MAKITRPVRAEINLANIRHQLSNIRRHIGEESEIMAVVKADAYGHGAVEVSWTALEAGANRLAVALPEEGMELRASGIRAPIQVFGETLAQQKRLLVDYNLIPTVCRKDTVKSLAQELKESETVYELPVAIKIDTGMGRLGILPEKLPEFYELIDKTQGLIVESLMTHFSSADEKDKSFTYEQWERMKRAVDLLENKLSADKELPKIQVANSAAIIDLPELAADIVRPGIMLYGLPPSPAVDLSFALKPVMSLKAGISYLKKVPANRAISYGATYVTSEEEYIATLPLGYADGYPRLLSNKGEVLIAGERCPIRGRVCMDMIMVDVSKVKDEVEVGDEAVIIGRQEEEEITATEIAEETGTINYEITCGISKRVPRQFLNLPESWER